MTHTYSVTGMTCTGCQAKVQSLLSKIPGVKNVTVELLKGEASIETDDHINTNLLKTALKDYPKYQLSEINQQNNAVILPATKEEAKFWFEIYKPVLLIFGYITGVTLLAEWVQGDFICVRWMNHFMAGFFLVFSFFKLLNLKGFAESYSMYDIVANKWNGWGYVYAFTELALGLAFLTRFSPILTNTVTFVVMTISIIGVLQSVINKRKIKCACLGAVFNLPMSTITIIEDLLMIGMSGTMLLTML
ncbi:MAG: heavy-metal-associated domain-containing protein [Chitinophagaceae bacterium]|nr:heavy-metal-associated domain-containing protein [Chitinophagaceae bacterium]MCA6441426.1 heavy-metal-associated domain-containing protein [Chitinophagaceae bacterium]